MCISVNIKATFQVLQLLTQKLQHNFRCAKKISVMSCRYGKGKDESRSTAIPPLHAVVVQSDNVHFLQDKFHWCPILSYLRTCPHREEQKKGLTLCFYNIWGCQHLNSQWNQNNPANNLLSDVLRSAPQCTLTASPEGIQSLRKAACCLPAAVAIMKDIVVQGGLFNWSSFTAKRHTERKKQDSYTSSHHCHPPFLALGISQNSPWSGKMFTCRSKVFVYFHTDFQLHILCHKPLRSHEVARQWFTPVF